MFGERQFAFLRNMMHLPEVVGQVHRGMDLNILHTEVQVAVAMPQEVRSQAVQVVIDNLGERLSRDPNFAFYYHGELGACYDSLKQRENALDHYEQALLLNPDPDNENFLASRVGYIHQVRLLTQGAIHAPRDRGTQTTASKLELVIGSTSRVVQKYPKLEDIVKECQAAIAWHQKLTGKKNGINFANISPN